MILFIKKMNKFKDRIGEKYITNQGYEIEVIDYIKYNDVTIKFEDGEVLYHRSYNDIQEGRIKHPFCPFRMCKDEYESLLNNVITNNLGYEMKIYNYRNYKDIDVIFLIDNSIAEHTTMDSFKHHETRHPLFPGISQEKLKERMDERIIKDGHIARIKEYRSSDDIDVIFDDGNVANGITYHSFHHGQFAYNHNDHVNGDYKKLVARRVYKSYIDSAKSRNIDFKLSNKDVEKLIFKNCFYCNCEPSNISYTTVFLNNKDIYYNGIDRIDSEKGYTLDNVVPCCVNCNYGKKDIAYSEWKNYLKRIHDYYDEYVQNDKKRIEYLKLNKYVWDDEE